MSRKEVNLSLRQVLVKRRDALRRVLAGGLSSLKKDRPQVFDEPDLDCVEDEVVSRLAEVESRELARVEYALERMREGRFGICEGCETNIPMGRLLALPYAIYCIRCQREAEHQSAWPTGDDWSRLLDSPSDSPDLSINDIEIDNL